MRSRTRHQRPFTPPIRDSKKRLTTIEKTITMNIPSSTIKKSFQQEAHGQPVVAVEFSPDPATSNLFATVGKNQVREKATVVVV